MSEKIDYILKRNARSRSIRIAVHVDGRVVVTAPRRVSLRFIEKFIEAKKSWIEEKINFFKVEGKIVKTGNNRQEFYKYKDRARKLVNDKLKELNQFYNFSFGRVSIRCTKTRWGSCSKSGNLNFNYRIVFLPESLVDYLIVHELCHLSEHNHSENFWKLVKKVIPDYKNRRKELQKLR